MEIPPHLLTQMREGRVALCLGAGASMGATVRGEQSSPPSTEELRDRIADRFLGGGYSEADLAWVAELAASASNPIDVQQFVGDQFRDIKPASFHYLIPKFFWRGLATTNFDRLVETVYDTADQTLQTCVPFLSNQERIDQKRRTPHHVLLLKLHGCVTRTTDPDLPLILTPEQYATYRYNRERVFDELEEWAAENTLVFVGQRIHDFNLRQILLSLTQKYQSRPQYYLVLPGVPQPEVDLWAKKGITVIDGTFEGFLRKLDAEIDPRTRNIVTAAPPSESPIVRRFVSNDESPSQSLSHFLHASAEYVHDALPIERGDPKLFYRGHPYGWYPVREGLDVRRRLSDILLEDVVLRREDDRPVNAELYLIQAEAGAGKSVLLRRLAWEAGTQADVLALYAKEGEPQTWEPLRELARATNDRIFFIVDNAAHRVGFIRGLMEFGRKADIPLTVITAERVNEWNVACEDLEDYVTDSYRLTYLSHSEIQRLVKLLTRYDSLGPNLRDKSFDECVEEFEKEAGRQLLVALHEATMGRPFEDIVIDEYSRLVPEEAQRLYVTVCALNRLKVPVRAGLMSRIHGIPFERFQKELFKPLEHVVHTEELPWGDYAYRARHSEIARIVFEEGVRDSTERFDEYARILGALNPAYSVDLEAVRGMIRAKAVRDLFPNYEDGKAVYELGERLLGEDPFFLQQRANYERIRDNGNLKVAEGLLRKAQRMEPRNRSIQHTLSLVLVARAKEASERLERQRYRQEASKILEDLDTDSEPDRYGAVARLDFLMDELRELLADTETPDQRLNEAIRKIEKALSRARQRHPGNTHVLGKEADYARLLQDHERVQSTLERARRTNPRDPHINARLASLLVRKGESDEAKSVLEDALEANRGERSLWFQYAELLRSQGEEGAERLAYYYKRAFSKWDQNHDAQFWYARFAFESSEADRREEAKEVFRHLRHVPARHGDQVATRDVIRGPGGVEQEFTGSMIRIEATHGFIAVDGKGEEVFVHQSDVVEGLWDQLSADDRVLFCIGFSLRGAKALTVRREGTGDTS